MRIAMWSGPRNLSTAMMYAFGARPDCAVWDEPFYAAYLNASGAPHPMAVEIIAAYETDPDAVATACAGPEPEAIWYQKHMCQHMLPAFPLDWMGEVTNVFLIRHPARVIASFHAKLENPNAEDVGLPRQLELYRHARRLTGRAPVVILHSGTTTSSRGRGTERDKNTCNWIEVGRESMRVSHLRWHPELDRFAEHSRHLYPRQGRAPSTLEGLVGAGAAAPPAESGG